MYQVRNYKMTIFPKLFLSFLVIIGSLYMLNLAMNNSDVRTIKREIEESLKSRVHFYHSTFETDLKRIIKLKQEYLYDKDLMELSFVPEQMSDYQFAEAILRIKTRLSLLKTSSLYMDDVHVYIPLIDRTISSTGYVDPPSAAEKNVLKQSNFVHPIVSWNGRILIGGVYPEWNLYDSEPLLTFKLQLSEENIRQSLQQIDNTGMGGAVLLDNNGEWAVYSKEAPSAEERLLAEQWRTVSKDSQSGTLYRKMDGQHYIVIYERSTVLQSTTFVYFPEDEVLGPLKANRLWFWWLSVASVGVTLAFSFWTYRLIHQPIRRMVQAFRKVENGDLTVAIHRRQEDEFSYLYTRFNAMVSELNVLIKEVYEQKIRSQRAELKQLQSQVNPHFLYNSYFVLYRIAKIPDMENVVRLTRHLGEYFRYITRSGSDEVALEEEVKHTLAYVQIQMFRFEQRIETRFAEVPEAGRTVHVPKLILQPIIENAYEHGLKETIADGLVTVEFIQRGQKLVIVVEDNGGEMTDEQIGELDRLLQRRDDQMETTGILNVHRRLQLKFGDDCGLSVSRASIGGLRVEMKIRLAPAPDTDR